MFRRATKTSNIWLGILPPTEKMCHTCIVLNRKKGLFHLIWQWTSPNPYVIKHSFFFFTSLVNSNNLTKLHKAHLRSKQPKQLFLFTVLCLLLLSLLSFKASGTGSVLICNVVLKDLRIETSSLLLTMWSLVKFILGICKWHPVIPKLNPIFSCVLYIWFCSV